MDETTAATMQNTQMLREIRDEIRSSRNVSLSAAGVSTPGNTGLIAKAQAASDRVLAADWASLGWSSAYTSQIRNSLFDDIGAVTGFSRSPSSLTQPEYVGMARENLFSLRPHNLVAGIIAPNYTARVNSLADSIFANSPRFARFGSSDSPLGIGLTRTGAYGLAKSIQGEAFTNMRLSGADLSQIAATGLQSGQFDTSSATEFMGKLRELAGATADVTRSMRMTVTEASQAMGGLRNIGVTSISDQRNVLMGVGAAAGVAGLTSGELLAGGFNAASTGVGLGLGAGQSMLGYARLAAHMRTMTQTGAISEQVMARAGGATGVASSIFNAEAQFAASDAGYFSHVGRLSGRQGGFLDEISGGVNEVAGGGFFGGLRSQRRRADLTARMSDTDRKENFKRYITQQIELMGVRDPLSEEAQDLAFNISKNYMDEASAQVYTTANFSRKGVLAGERSRYLSASSRALQESKLAEDERYTYNSFTGRFARARGMLGKQWAGIAEGAAGLVTPGQRGLFGLGSNIAQQAEDVRSGLVTHNADILSMVRAADYENAMQDNIKLYSMSENYGGIIGESVGLIGGTLGGAWLGVKAGAAVGIAGGIPGVIAGAIGGAVVGTGAAFALGAVGSLIDQNRKSSTTLTGQSARHYMQVARAMKGPDAMASGMKVLKTGKLSESAAFRDLTSSRHSLSRGDMSVTDSVGFAEKVEQIVNDTKLSVEDVVAGIRAAGVEGNMASAFGGFSGGQAPDIVNDLRKIVGESSTVNFSLSENAAALQEFAIAAVNRDSDQKSLHARYTAAAAGLRSIGVSSKGIDEIHGRLMKMGEQRHDFAAKLGATASYGASRQMRDFATGVFGYAEDLVSSASGEEREALMGELKSVRERMNAGATSNEVLTSLMSGGTKLSDFLAAKSPLIRSVSGLTARELTGTEAEALSTKYGMGADVFKQIQDQIKSGALESGEQGVTAARIQAMRQEVAKSEGEGMSSESRAIINTFKAASQAMTAATEALKKISQ